MRRMAPVGLALASLATAVALAPAGSARYAAAPSISVRSKAPLTVAGRAWAPRERVRIDVFANGTQLSRSTAADGSGSFVLTVKLTLGRCAGGTIRAHGSAGSSATAKIPRLGCSLG